ncbi:MAG: outer membrane protein transport protein [Aquabacterium sp.]
MKMADARRFAALAPLLVALPAMAALTDNLGTSVKAMSMGNAVTADPPGIDAIHFNPAGLSHLEGRVRQDNLFGASIRIKSRFQQPDGFNIGGWNEDPLSGTSSGPVRQKLYIPGVGPTKFGLPMAVGAGMGFSFNKPGSPWTFATETYVPQAVGIDRSKDPNDPSRFDGRSVIMQRFVYFSPSVAYKFSDTLSVGLAVPFAHQGFALDTDMRFPNKLLGIIGKLQDAWCGDNGGNPLDEFGFGLCGGGKEGRLRPFNRAGTMQFDMTAPLDPTYNLGVLWEPKDWFGWGLVYQSGTKTTLTGRYTFTADPMFPKFVQGMYSSLLGPVVAAMFGFPTSIPGVESGNATMKLPFPAHWQMGFKVKPLSNVQFNADVNYTDWSKWDKLEIQFDKQVALLQMARIFGQADASKLVIPRNYKDPIHFGFGMEVGLTKAFKVRFGYEPRKTSVPQSAFDLIAPLPTMTVRSVGVGYEAKSGLKVDATFSYAKGHYNIPAETSCNLNCSNFFNVIYNPYAGLDVSGSMTVRYGGMSITQPF